MPEINAHVSGTPCWFDLMTPNPKLAMDFYGHVFGWSFDVGGPETAGYTMCRLKDLKVAGLGQLPSTARLPTAWNVYFAVSDVQAAARLVEQAGGTVTMGPMPVLDHGELAMVKDCTGAVFGLWQAKTHVGAQLVREPNTLTWCEVSSRDRQRTATFYQSVFQLEARGLDESERSTLHRRDEAVCGVIPIVKEWGETAPHWTVYFASDDANSAVARVVAAGGRLCYPVSDTPHGRLAVVEDPMGAAFSIIQPPIAFPAAMSA